MGSYEDSGARNGRFSDRSGSIGEMSVDFGAELGGIGGVPRSSVGGGSFESHVGMGEKKQLRVEIRQLGVIEREKGGVVGVGTAVW